MSDYISDLERLEALRARGTISQEEFDAAKSKLLTPAPAQTVGLPVLPVLESREPGREFREYPVWLMATISFFTLGGFTFFWLNHWHGVMPKRRRDDWSTARANWCLFIPLYNIYWQFETVLRLCTRLDEEFASAGHAARARSNKGLLITFIILGFVPYLNILTSPILGAIVTARFQSLVNGLANLEPLHPVAAASVPLS